MKTSPSINHYETQNKEDLNNFLLNETIKEALKINDNKYKELCKNKFYFTLVIVSFISFISSRILTDGIWFILFLCISILFFGTFVLCFLIELSDKSDHTGLTYFKIKINNIFNIKGCSNISDIDGILMFISTIEKSEYNQYLDNSKYKRDLLYIRSIGKISEKNRTLVNETYDKIASNLFNTLSEYNGNQDTVKIKETEQLSIERISEIIDKRQEQIIKSFIISNKGR